MAYEIKSVTRAFMILEAIAEEALSPSDLAVKLDMNKSTLHRFLSTLSFLGYIERDKDNTIHLSHSFSNLTTRGQNHGKVIAAARPYLEELACTLQESAFLAVFNGRKITYVDNIESQYAVRTVFDPGRKAPAHAVASGKLFLSELAEKELEDFLQKEPLIYLTKNTITDPIRLKSELASIKKKGYACDHEEYELGLKGFACPIRNHNGNIAAAICIAGIASRITNNTVIHTTIAQLSNAAAEISVQLGYPKNLTGGIT